MSAPSPISYSDASRTPAEPFPTVCNPSASSPCSPGSSRTRDVSRPARISTPPRVPVALSRPSPRVRARSRQWLPMCLVSRDVRHVMTSLVGGIHSPVAIRSGWRHPVSPSHRNGLPGATPRVHSLRVESPHSNGRIPCFGPSAASNPRSDGRVVHQPRIPITYCVSTSRISAAEAMHGSPSLNPPELARFEQAEHWVIVESDVTSLDRLPTHV